MQREIREEATLASLDRGHPNYKVIRPDNAVEYVLATPKTRAGERMVSVSQMLSYVLHTRNWSEAIPAQLQLGSVMHF